MFMRKILNLAVLCLLAGSTPLSAQNEEPEQENKSILNYWQQSRTYPGNNPNAGGRALTEMQRYRNNNPQQLSANWSYINASGNLYGDVGRANSITHDPLQPNTYYVCTPNSGVWRTTDGGNSYTPITELLPTQSTSKLVIDPQNTAVLYLATGRHNMDLRPNSIGIYKSVDGGINWNVTGLTFAAENGITIGDLVMNPQNHLSLLAACSDGLYRTYDGGTTWTRILNAYTCSVRFKPGDTTLIYTSGHAFYRSADAGSSFINITSGIFTSYTWRYECYVRTCTAAPQLVYLSTAGISNSTMRQFIHKSTDSGQNFVIADSLSGQPCAQFEASEQTPDKYLAGYYYVMMRNGSSAQLQQLTSTTTSLPAYAHSDQRGMFFDPQNDQVIYLCNDGGLFRSTDNGASFQQRTGNMQLAHYYRFASSQQTSYKILTSPLDVPPYIIGSNGINNTFTQFVESFSSAMSPLNDSLFWITHQNPLFTVNNGSSFFSANTTLIINSSYNKNAFQYDRCDAGTCYFGAWNDFYKSTDYGHTFTMVGSTGAYPPNSFMTEFRGLAVARANPQYIYAFYDTILVASVNGGSQFSIITGTLPTDSAFISHVEVDPANEKNVWVSFSGFSAGNKVFFSADGGQTWTNRSAGLPNIPVNVLKYQAGIPGALYAGTDGGVFYIDNTFSSWQYYNTGLPNVIITDLDVQEATGKLRAATFGRGAWESDLYQPTPPGYQLPPAAIFTVGTACTGQPTVFTATPCGAYTSVQWLFPGGTPNTSTSMTPGVTYPAPGSYNVTLIVYGPGGNDTITQLNAVTIPVPTAIPYLEDVPDLNNYQYPAGFSTVDVNGDGYSWERMASFGSSGISDDCIRYDNFQRPLLGQEEKLILPALDLSAATNPKLYFKHSYGVRNTSPLMMDTLKVAVHACGGSDTILFKRGGTQLATVPGLYFMSEWIPYQTTDWQADSIDLSLFAGADAVTISFINQGNWGQCLYLDAFNIMDQGIPTGTVQTQNAAPVVFPNPAGNVVYISSNAAMLRVQLTDVSGRVLETRNGNATMKTMELHTETFAPGLYLLHIQTTSGSSTQQLLIRH